MNATTKVTRNGEVFAVREVSGTQHYIGEVEWVRGVWVAKPKAGDVHTFASRELAVNHLLSLWR